MPNLPDFSSPTYPFARVISANTLKGAEIIPYKILMYLLDLPDAAGYTPPSGNDYPRARLMKYLWNDGARPLDDPLPTPAEKTSLLFDPYNPDINTDDDKKKHPKGYRLFAQRVVNQSLLEAKTFLKIYPGRILDDTDFRTVIGFQAEIWCNYGLVTNTKTTAYDRTFDIECCLREALAGVDIAGVGTIRFSRQASSYNGSEILYTDSQMCGRMLYFSTSWAEGGGDVIKTY
jgi:hypothetical protein